MNDRWTIQLTAAVLLFSAASLAGAQDAAAPIKMCVGCHGEDGISKQDFIPTIAGLPAFVHADDLHAYREGTRTCSPKGKAMCSISKRLTDEQIEALAEHFSAMEFKPAVQEFDADKATAGAVIHEEKCSKCHKDSGSNPEGDVSILAGQWMPYLKYSMEQFVAGERWQPEAMQRKTQDATAEDIDNLVHYYGSQQ